MVSIVRVNLPLHVIQVRQTAITSARYVNDTLRLLNVGILCTLNVARKSLLYRIFVRTPIPLT